MSAKEKELLRKHYLSTREYVKDSPYHIIFADEKIHHSLQVLGAGKYILKHEPAFQNRSPEFIGLAKTACILHDIGRFDEIKKLYELSLKCHSENSFVPHYDHGELGCKILQNIREYNDPRLTIAVRHHGHLIEDFYADLEYQNIQEAKLSEEIEKIIFLVRDADKIANINLLMTDNEQFKRLFFDNSPIGPFNPELLNNFFAAKTINRNQVHSRGDRILHLIAWIFDLNFKISFKYLNDCGRIQHQLNCLRQCNPDTKFQEKIENFVNSYISNVLKQ